MNKKGILVVVSGFSGAGKGCLMKALLNSYDCYALSVSATTRDPREGEINGREYFFVTEERFREMIEQEALYEYAEYQNHFYGTPRSYVDDRLNEGKDVILEIDVQGAETIKKRFPDTVLIFITPPSAKELERRLVERGSETPDKIRGRLLRAVEEAKYLSSMPSVTPMTSASDDADCRAALVCMLALSPLYAVMTLAVCAVDACLAISQPSTSDTSLATTVRSSLSTLCARSELAI